MKGSDIIKNLEQSGCQYSSEMVNRMRTALEAIAEEIKTPGPGHCYKVKGRIQCAEIARKALNPDSQ